MTWNGSKTPRRKCWEKVFNIGLGNDFGQTLEAQMTKPQKKKGLHQNKKLLFSKRNTQQNEKAVYWMEENVCKLYVRYGVDI